MTLRMRVLPRFPATISGTKGTKVVRDGVNLQVNLDFSSLTQIPAPISDTTTFFALWDEGQDSFLRMSFYDAFNSLAGFSAMSAATYDPQGIAGDAFDRANHTGTQAASTVTGLTSAISSIADKQDKVFLTFGQCRLALSGGNIALTRRNGRLLTIDGVHQVIPSGGITLAPTALTPGTLYYVYAYMNTGTMTLEASTTGHSADATTGVEIKTGDSTRTLVGMARPITGPAWADAIGQRFVRSWFNRKSEAMRKAFTAIRSTTSTSFVEINSEIRCEWLQWSDEIPTAHIQGTASNDTANVRTITAIGWDGTEDANASVSVTSATGLAYNCSTSAPKEGLSEGYHYATLKGAVSAASTGNWTGGITGIFTSMSVRIGQ